MIGGSHGGPGWLIHANTLFKRGNSMSEKFSIKHVLADGRKVDSIDSFVIPNTW